MKKSFGVLPTGEQTYLYTISCGGITATVTDLGATLVSVFVPDADGNLWMFGGLLATMKKVRAQ